MENEFQWETDESVNTALNCDSDPERYVLIELCICTVVSFLVSSRSE